LSKKATHRKKTKVRKVREKKKMEKRKDSSHLQNRPISKAGKKINVAIKAQEPQPSVAKTEVGRGCSRTAHTALLGQRLNLFCVLSVYLTFAGRRI